MSVSISVVVCLAFTFEDELTIGGRKSFSLLSSISGAIIGKSFSISSSSAIGSSELIPLAIISSILSE